MRSSYGRAFISIRDDEIAAEAMGVDTTRFKVLSFVISSMFAGIAGGSVRALHDVSAPEFVPVHDVVLSDHHDRRRRTGKHRGAVLGAILVTVALEVFRGFGAFRLVNFAVLLVLIMIYRPQGLVGRRHGYS